MQEWTNQELLKKLANNETTIIYFYTPLCGTCKVGSRMVTVVNELLPSTDIGMCNLNYHIEIAKEWMIESVPCLVIYHKGEVEKKIYAMQSVEYLYNELKIY